MLCKTHNGADQIFIGMENINADNLAAAKKKQNRVEDYRAMFLAWKKHPVVITCGYIIGFPNDTYQSIMKDIETKYCFDRGKVFVGGYSSGA